MPGALQDAEHRAHPCTRARDAVGAAATRCETPGTGCARAACAERSSATCGRIPDNRKQHACGQQPVAEKNPPISADCAGCSLILISRGSDCGEPIGGADGASAARGRARAVEGRSGPGLDLLAEQSLRERESATKVQPGDDVQQWRTKLSEQQEQERRAFLGEKRFQAWTEYVQGAGARRLVSELRTELATSSSPLSEVQIKPLVKALAAEQQRSWAERQENHSGLEWTDETPVAEKGRVHGTTRQVGRGIPGSIEGGAIYLIPPSSGFSTRCSKGRANAHAEVVSWRASWRPRKGPAPVRASRNSRFCVLPINAALADLDDLISEVAHA